MNLDNVGNVIGQLVLKVDLHLVLLDLVVEARSVAFVKHSNGYGTNCTLMDYSYNV